MVLFKPPLNFLTLIALVRLLTSDDDIRPGVCELGIWWRPRVVDDLAPNRLEKEYCIRSNRSGRGSLSLSGPGGNVAYYSIILETARVLDVLAQSFQILSALGRVMIRRLVEENSLHIEPWISRGFGPACITVDVLNGLVHGTLAVVDEDVANGYHIGICIQLWHLPNVVVTG